MITAYWKDFTAYITSFGLSLEQLGFRKGASLASIQQAEQQMTIKLPQDYTQLLLLSNGQEPYDGITGFFKWLPTNMRLLSIEEVVEKWKWQREFDVYGEESNFYEEFEDKDRIRCVMYDQHRISVAEYYQALADLYLDFIPAPHGKQGQLITNVNECEFVVLATDFTELLKNYLNLIRAGVLTFGNEKSEYGEGFTIYSEQCFEGNKLVALFDKYRS